MSLEWNGFELRNEQNLADLGIVNHSKLIVGRIFLEDPALVRVRLFYIISE
jgi:hypothetical protein